MSEQTEVNKEEIITSGYHSVVNKMTPIEELKLKYGAEIVEAKVKEIEEQVKEKVTELDEALFVQSTLKPEPEVPNEEEIMNIIGLMNNLYIAEAKVFALINAQHHKQTKHIPQAFKQRLNNLFVNNRVLMDYFHKRFDWADVSYQNQLATSTESIMNLFIACKQVDREYCITNFKEFLQTKYLTDGQQSETTTTDQSVSTNNVEPTKD